MLGNVKAFILSICAAVVFTTLLVSANTMAMSIRERTREVAVLKTLGFHREDRPGAVCERGRRSIAGWRTVLARLRRGMFGLTCFARLRGLGMIFSAAKVTPGTHACGFAAAGIGGIVEFAAVAFLPRSSRVNIVDGLAAHRVNL